MSNDAIKALITIATSRITDPNNTEAINLRKIAVSAVASLKEEILAMDNEPSEFKTDIEKAVLQIFIDTLGVENPHTIKKTSTFKDLDVDNLDLIEIQMCLEETFGISIHDDTMGTLSEGTIANLIEFIKTFENSEHFIL